MTDEPSHHLLDLNVPGTETDQLLFRDVAPPSGDAEVRARFAAFTARAIEKLRKVPVGALGKSVGNQRGDGVRRISQLLAQLRIALEAGSLQDRRNCISRTERFLIKLQFLDAFGAQACRRGSIRARPSVVESL
jgi:hypothetical protein